MYPFPINGATAFNYDGYNRLSSASGMSYYVNPEGQRLKKSSASGTSYFAPDKGGSLLAETQGSGWTDYIWLGGRLIGKMTNSQPYAVFVDQVGRPEVVADPNRAVVWRAQNFPFYQKVVTANVSFNLGFPGQYFDAETSTWNNGFRDYSSVYGRYIESDSLGLAGGNNTYAYVGNNPLSGIDPLGLHNIVGQIGAAGVMGIGGTGSVGIYVTLPSPGTEMDIGVYASAGGAGGDLLGMSSGLGYVKGDESDIKGIAYNGEIAGGVGDLTITGSSPDSPTGFILGPAAEFGGAVSVTKTYAYGARDLGSMLGILLYNKLHKDSRCH